MKDLILYFGLFVFGIIIGDLGNLFVVEVSQKYYNYTVFPEIRVISYWYTGIAVVLYVIFAIPATIISLGGCSNCGKKRDYTKQDDFLIINSQ